MKSGMQKGSVIILKKGQLVVFEEVQMPDDERLNEVEEDGYKYLGIL